MSDIRRIPAQVVEDAVCQLFLHSNTNLPQDVTDAIQKAQEGEDIPLAREIMNKLRENAAVAADKQLPICQDTGMAVVFVTMGNRVVIEGASLTEAVNRGVRRAYLEGGLRLSVVKDPLFDRSNTGDNTPAVIHLDAVEGDQLTITAVPKGFGSENMAAIKMFTPASEVADIVSFVVETVRKAGANACPPMVVGVGIGSDFEGVALLAKKALLEPLDRIHPQPRYAELEKTVLDKINALGIGPQGFAGNTTALAVRILSAPTHIAGLPCAVNINCHVARHATVTI